MRFWKRIKNEVEDRTTRDKAIGEINLQLVKMARDIDIISNRLEILDSVVKSNRAKINKIKILEIEGETEKNKNTDKVYL